MKTPAELVSKDCISNYDGNNVMWSKLKCQSQKWPSAGWLNLPSNIVSTVV